VEANRLNSSTKSKREAKFKLIKISQLAKIT